MHATATHGTAHCLLVGPLVECESWVEPLALLLVCLLIGVDLHEQLARPCLEVLASIDQTYAAPPPPVPRMQIWPVARFEAPYGGAANLSGLKTGRICSPPAQLDQVNAKLFGSTQSSKPLPETLSQPGVFPFCNRRLLFCGTSTGFAHISIT